MGKKAPAITTWHVWNPVNNGIFMDIYHINWCRFDGKQKQVAFGFIIDTKVRIPPLNSRSFHWNLLYHSVTMGDFCWVQLLTTISCSFIVLCWPTWLNTKSFGRSISKGCRNPHHFVNMCRIVCSFFFNLIVAVLEQWEYCNVKQALEETLR